MVRITVFTVVITALPFATHSMFGPLEFFTVRKKSFYISKPCYCFAWCSIDYFAGRCTFR